MIMYNEIARRVSDRNMGRFWYIGQILFREIIFHRRYSSVIGYLWMRTHLISRFFKYFLDRKVESDFCFLKNEIKIELFFNFFVFAIEIAPIRDEN